MFFEIVNLVKINKSNCDIIEDFWLSYEGRMVDALAYEDDEGRGKLR